MTVPNIQFLSVLSALSCQHCPVSNYILSLVNQLLLQAVIVLADALCSLETCCSPLGFDSLDWSCDSLMCLLLTFERDQ